MAVAMTVETTGGSEVYTTSARVGREVDTSSIGAQGLTEIIVACQREIDSQLENMYAVPFAAGSVPVELEEICTNLVIARVIRATRTKTSGTSEATEGWLTVRKDALAWLLEIAEGRKELHNSSGTVIQRLMEEYALTIVTAATPTANHTIVTDMDSFDLRRFRLIARVTGAPSGIVKVSGELDDGEQVNDWFYVTGTGDFTGGSAVNFYHVTAVDSSRVTGGTSPQVAILAVQNSGKTYAGEVV